MRTLQQGKDFRQMRITEAAKTSYAYITNNHNSLKQEITQHKNYLIAECHTITITQGMRKRKPWTEHMEQIIKDLSDLNAMIYNNNIHRYIRENSQHPPGPASKSNLKHRGSRQGATSIPRPTNQSSPPC